MDTLLFVILIATIFVVTFYFVYNAGFQDGCNMTFKAYIQEWVEIRQRVSNETWQELVKAYSIMDDRKKKLKNRQKR